MTNYKKYKNDLEKENDKKLFNKKIDSDKSDIFLNKNETDAEFLYKDTPSRDTSDDNRSGIDELDELIEINKLGRYIEIGQLYNEIIAKLSLILNYNVIIKKMLISRDMKNIFQQMLIFIT